MKKNILLVLMLLGSFLTVQAQDSIVTKKGKPILPKSGDLAVGLNASTFLTYAGNMFNGDWDNGSPSANFLNGSNLGGQAVYFKYFIDDDRAIRVAFEATTTRSLNKRYVFDYAARVEDPLSNDMVIDTRNYKNSDYQIGLGYEMRRGRSRLQGFYGGGVVLGFGGQTSTYEYANPFSELYTSPVTNDYTYNFGSNINGDRRMLTDENNRYVSVGLGGFIGVEYFFAPCISLGAELGWGINFAKNFKELDTYEEWTGTEAEEIKVESDAGGRNFYTGTADPSANLFFMFHF